MRTPTTVSAGRLARCLSLRSPAGLGRLVALLLGEAAPDAVDLPGPQREREALGPDRAARASRPGQAARFLSFGAAPCDQVRGQGPAACRRNRFTPAGRRRRPAGTARAPARPAAAARPGPDGTAARPTPDSHARSASRQRPRTGRPFHAVAHHEFLLIWPAQRGLLPGVVSFSVTRRSTARGC
jgi:hypothetical protein